MLTVFEKVLVLQDLEFFSFAHTEHLAEFAARCRALEVEKGTVLFRQGDAGNALHIVTFGRVSLERMGQPVEFVENDCLGCWSVLSESPYQYTACTEDHCSLLVVSYEDLVDYFTTEPEFCWAIMKHLARRRLKEIDSVNNTASGG
jgi:CRP-like cAMP-binding protein